ncbi:PQQ-binding-like beta-propeller repeat protein [Pirellulaceae bacterium SH467]
MERRAWLKSVVGGASIAATPRLLFADRLEWPTWRGPDRNGAVQGDWPDSLDEKCLSALWNRPLGDSYSGPVASGDLVFTTESKAGKEFVYALALADGEVRWRVEWKGALNVPFFAARNGNWIRATPATDGKTLFVGGIRDVLVALDAATGEEKWRIDFAERFGKVPDFGMVCSPIIDGKHLYIQAGKGLHKLQCDDGTILWSSLQDAGDMMTSGAFSSPIIGEFNGVRQLLVQTRTLLAGVNLESGEPYWKYEVAAFRGMNILTPTLWKNALFTSSYGGRSLLIDVEENRTPKVRWENKIEGYMSSPVVLGDHLYMHLRNQRFACLDLSTGKEAWISKPFGEYWSLVTNGERILALDQDGTLRLIQHNPLKFQVISERALTTNEEEAWAHVGLLDGKVMVRSQKGMTVYNWSKA